MVVTNRWRHQKLDDEDIVFPIGIEKHLQSVSLDMDHKLVIY